MTGFLLPPPLLRQDGGKEHLFAYIGDAASESTMALYKLAIQAAPAQKSCLRLGLCCRGYVLPVRLCARVWLYVYHSLSVSLLLTGCLAGHISVSVSLSVLLTDRLSICLSTWTNRSFSVTDAQHFVCIFCSCRLQYYVRQFARAFLCYCYRFPARLFVCLSASVCL